LYPPGCDKLDYEIELAVVIKEMLKNASPEEAARAISGYTLMCDYSERANQLEHGGQWTKGKSYDSFAPMGPTFISADELGDGAGIPLELRVNGEVRQSGNTDGLIWPVPRLIAYVSRFMTLWPGDVVSTGTPGGVGMGMKPPVYLKPGDVVEWGSPAFGFASQAVVIDDEG
jgi:2,4-diketo-3-deoxy-L-fuconate hydrolase